MQELTEEQLNSLVNIKVLDLRDNKLEALPDHITFLQALERLDITNNNLSTLVIAFLCYLDMLCLNYINLFNTVI